MKRSLACLLLLCAAPVFAEQKKTGKARGGSAGRIAKSAPVFEPEAINNPATVDPVGPDAAGSAVVRAQILLDRAHFSPGEIDGRYGDNLRVAVLGYQAARQLPSTGIVDAATWQALNADGNPALVPYTITAEDVKGPFTKTPDDMMAKSKLKSLGYASVEEALGEKFHINPGLLEKLNPAKKFEAGQEILVPNVTRESLEKAARVEVSKANRTLSVYRADGQLLAQYPATMGSEHDPLPIGEWAVTVVQKDPIFNYNPDLFWDADPGHSKARIAPGPNNPVGSVWIGLTKEHYGIHGTPNPAGVGHAESHGCIRLTNWDALELAQMTAKGMPVILKE